MRKSDGTYTYFVPDVAYHLDKWRRPRVIRHVYTGPPPPPPPPFLVVATQ